MIPCSEQIWKKFYPSYASDADAIAARYQANQFWCPDAFDLSIYNKFDNPVNKILSLTFQPCQRGTLITCVNDVDRQKWLDGKQIFLMINSQRIDLN